MRCQMNISGVFNNYSEIKSTDKFQQEKCLVCMESFSTSHSDNKSNDSPIDPKITRLACGHIFHTNCLANYIDTAHQEQRKKCMICKDVFEINNKILTEELLKNLKQKEIPGCRSIYFLAGLSFISFILMVSLPFIVDKTYLESDSIPFIGNIPLTLLFLSMFSLMPIPPMVMGRDILMDREIMDDPPQQFFVLDNMNEID